MLACTAGLLVDMLKVVTLLLYRYYCCPSLLDESNKPIQLIIPPNFPIILELFFYATKVYYSRRNNMAGLKHK